MHAYNFYEFFCYEELNKQTKNIFLKIIISFRK